MVKDRFTELDRIIVASLRLQAHFENWSLSLDRQTPRLDGWNATLYTYRVIKTFRHKGLQAFFETGSRAGIQPHHAPRLKRQLTRLDLAKSADDMNVPGWKLHRLSSGHWSVWVNGNWRVTFIFEGTDAVLVDYQDYH